MADFLSQYAPQTCEVNGETLIYFGDKEDAFEIPDKAFYVLPHMGVLSIEGEDATTFLQGQLTIDVTEFNPGQIGLYCNKEGRIISLFYLNKDNDAFQLVMPKSILPLTQKTLKRYGMFSKVSITPLPMSVLMTKDGNKLQPLLISQESLVLMCQGLKEKQVMLGSLSWHYHQLHQHIPSIYPATTGKWLPHRIGLHKKQALNFEKGCYLGQEIIARMHFKSKLKHTPLTFLMDTTKEIGESLLLDNKTVGEVIDTCPCKDDKQLILASILKEVAPKVEADSTLLG